MQTTELRQTKSGSPGIRPARKAFDPTQLFAQRDRLPWFWFFVAVAVTVLAAFDRYHLIGQFKQRERVVIIDPSQTYYISPLLKFQEGSGRVPRIAPRHPPTPPDVRFSASGG